MRQMNRHGMKPPKKLIVIYRGINMEQAAEKSVEVTSIHKPFSFKKLFESFGYALKGVAYLLESEQNARVHTVITICVGIAVWLFHVSRLEAAILFIAVILVFAIEIINTAIEKVFDVCHPEHHDTIMRAKDAMAGAVLISAVIATVVAFLVFLPHIIALF